jgi:hypothetical protein
MENRDVLFDLGFRDYVHKLPAKQDGKKRLLFYGVYLDRSLVVILVEDLKKGGAYEIERISLDHDNEKEHILKLFGELPTLESLVRILKSNNLR